MPAKQIVKTQKMLINSSFVRSEGGETYLSKGGTRLCAGTRKDVRNAVEATLSSANNWSSRIPYNRGQILYRLAEMLSSRSGAFVHQQLTESLDAIVYYAGFCDKYQQILGAINPISGPFVHQSSYIPMGTIALLAGEQTSLAAFLASLSAILCTGNSVVALSGQCFDDHSAELAEALATSDLPAGAVNLLTGNIDDLLATFAGHREIRGILALNPTGKQRKTLIENRGDNLKNLVFSEGKDLFSSELVLEFTHLRSQWQSIGY